MQENDYYTITESGKIDVVKWVSLLERSGNANPFHSPGFYSLISSVDGYEPFIVLVGNKDEYLAAAVGSIQKETGLLSFFSRRAIIEGGFVFSDKDSVVLVQMLVRSLIYFLSKKAIYLEIRNYNDYKQYKSVFEENGFEYLPYLNFHVNCRDAEKMKGGINKGKLRQINGSLKAGAEIIENGTEKQVREFYDILFNLYRSRVKKPLPPWPFFRDFAGSGFGTYLLVNFQDRIVGGIMCPFDKNAIYEWYVAGLDNQIEKVFPSILATWAAMDFAVRNNIPRFDFMGAGQPDQDYGVREFKSRFGGELVEHGRFRKIFNPLLFNAGKTGLKILGKLR